MVIKVIYAGLLVGNIGELGGEFGIVRVGGLKGGVYIWILAEEVVCIDKLCENVSENVDIAEYHVGCRFGDLHVGYLIELLFF